MDSDCYFFVDLDVPEADRTMSVLCVDCHEKFMPNTGWFYRGSVEGYGPFDYQCCRCGVNVHDMETNADTEEEDTPAS